MKTLERSTADRSPQTADEASPAEPDASELAATICQIFAVHLTIEVPTIETDLVENGLLDSLAVVDLIMQLELEFDFAVAIDELDIEDFRTVERIAAYVARCKG